ncbi:MAG: hypothetical protein WC992_04865 [Acholeplasmataceae bacterium]|nr:hypothetical protein [Acholeplasmataceae bacterium]
MKSKELCNYLERLRAARNISQESFTNGITSLRQYRRYLSGESDIPFQVFDRLCGRLGIQTINLLREIETTRIEESKEIDTFYNLVVYNNHEEVDRLRNIYKDREFIDYENSLLFEHSVILYDFINQKITAENAAEKNKELIHFSKIAKQSIFSLTEMLILTSLLDLDPKVNDKQMIASRLKTILNDSSVVLGSSVNFAYPLVLFRLAKYSGSNKDYVEVIDYCLLGIKHGMDNKNFYLLDYFYYYSALAYYRLGDYVNYEGMLIKCFEALHLDGNQLKIEKFTQMINRDFNISFSEFVIEHYKNN